MFFYINKYILLVHFFLWCLCFTGQSVDYYIKTYNLQANSYGGNIAELNDGGFINSAANIDTIVSSTKDTSYVEVIALYRVNKSGGIKWAKNYILSSNCAYGGSFCLSKDSTIALVSVDFNTLVPNPDYLFFKTDLNGTLLTSTAVGTPGNEYAMDIKQLNDENYLICGYSDGGSAASSQGDFNLVKLNKNGSLLFSKLYLTPDSTYDFPLAMEIDKKQDVYIFGDSNKYNDIYTGIGQAVKTDQNGNLLWLSKFGPVIPSKMHYYNLTCGTISKNNDLVTAGITTVFDTSNVNWTRSYFATISFFNSNGGINFSKKYYWKNNASNNLTFNSIIQRKDKIYAASFNTYDSLGNSSSGVALIDTLGNIKKTTVFSSSLYLSKINNIKHNGVVLNGANFNNFNSTIVKLDSNLHIKCEKDTNLIFVSAITFTSNVGGVANNIGTQHPSLVIEKTKNIDDSTLCFKTIVTTTTALAGNTIQIASPQKETCSNNSLFLPNTFTPNNDGQNDVFYVRGINNEEIDFLIVNRWGELVFETKDKLIGWDGLYKGKICSPGVYGWYIKVKCDIGEVYTRKGSITLIR
ncbi:MAG: gliding motility-associated C-terminal domain-containing protein [Bacteroidetes bacterium]|nr:gliding motility-associated C-terminal domain-containing protein [Bacteroidota bacterium]